MGIRNKNTLKNKALKACPDAVGAEELAEFILLTHREGHQKIWNPANELSSRWCKSIEKVDNLFVMTLHLETFQSLWNPKNGKSSREHCFKSIKEVGKFVVITKTNEDQLIWSSETGTQIFLKANFKSIKEVGKLAIINNQKGEQKIWTTNSESSTEWYKSTKVVGKFVVSTRKYNSFHALNTMTGESTTEFSELKSIVTLDQLGKLDVGKKLFTDQKVWNPENGLSSEWCKSFKIVGKLVVLTNRENQEKVWNPENGLSSEWCKSFKIVGKLVVLTNRENQEKVWNPENGLSSEWCKSFKIVGKLVVLTNQENQEKVWNPDNGLFTEWYNLKSFKQKDDSFLLVSQGNTVSYLTIDTMELSPWQIVE